MTPIPLLRNTSTLHAEVYELLMQLGMTQPQNNLFAVNISLRTHEPDPATLNRLRLQMTPLFNRWGFLKKGLMDGSNGSYGFLPAMPTLQRTWNVMQLAQHKIRTCMGHPPKKVFLLSGKRQLQPDEMEFLLDHEFPGTAATEGEAMRHLWFRTCGHCFHKPLGPTCVTSSCSEVIEAETTVIAYRKVKDAITPEPFYGGGVSLFTAEPFGARLRLEFDIVFGQGYGMNRYEPDDCTPDAAEMYRELRRTLDLLEQYETNRMGDLTKVV